MARKLPTGIRRTPTGYQAYVRVCDPMHHAGSLQASKRFPRGTAWSEMRDWRQRRRLGLDEGDNGDHTTFAEDAEEYLSRSAVQRMPTYRERAKHIHWWVSVFGARDRQTIHPQHVQKALDRLQTTPWVRGKGRAQRTGNYTASSLNKRRTALMHLWTVLDGRQAANPAKGVQAYRESEPVPRAPALNVVLRILDAFPTTKTRARLKLLAWTGWPQAIIKQLRPGDFDLKGARAFVASRRKGAGAPARWLPLLPEAVAACKEFHRSNAYGDFSNSSLRSKLVAQCVRLGLSPIRPYDLRHQFLTLVATLTRDERAVLDLGLLRTPQMARRYTQAATQPRTQAAVADVAKQLPRLIRQAAASRLRGDAASGSTWSVKQDGERVNGGRKGTPKARTFGGKSAESRQMRP